MTQSCIPGIKIRIGTDLAELVTLRPDRTMTTWDPQFFPGGEAFWLHGIGGDNSTIFVIAARFFLIQEFSDDVGALRCFYKNPVARCDECFVENILAGLIKGNAACDGNLWVDPAYRGIGIPAIATRALHVESLRRWPDAEWFFGLMEKELAYKGMWQDQGYPHCEGQVIWDHSPYGQRFDMKVVYGSREEISRSL